ncbi:MAG: hypothetical protein NT090_20245 [Acidobacteria bacterium]|jgi:hypothetical protein|nr:hypothetical protein [Acidobacteriota bacterium]
MAKAKQAVMDPAFLNAALEGLELQRERIAGQIQQVKSLLGGKKPRAVPAAAARKGKPAAKRVLSETARKRIAKAQKKRWAAYRKAKRAAGKAGV